ncbi:MAG: iron ABC transporter permease [Candidatus Goldbacteria bacterium]|nr:iron ABC transporter permease [Candidatus Goldiibacteriota bacterium]
MRKKIFVLILSVLLLIIVFISFVSGSINITIKEIFNSFFNKNLNNDNALIILKIRLPRILLAILVGGVLSVTGAILQALFKNPLVDPFITGVSSGAAFGATIAIIFNLNSITLLAVLGAVFTILFVYGLSRKNGNLNLYNLLLTGVMVSSFFSALIMFLSAFFNKDLVKVVFWLMGDLSITNFVLLKYSYVISIIIIIFCIFFSNDLNILSLDEDEAKVSGVRTEFIKTFYFIASGILTGIAVALSGVIGFVGLVIPHVVRFFTGPDLRGLIPVSFIAGAAFLLGCDTIARTIFLPSEIPVGIITGLVGAPVFVFILLRRK